ncbi:MAG: agmatine deiminase family protein [Myxococcales bacterium]|nr:agmatine deiminase family protein [Myxococcales bacterium]
MTGVPCERAVPDVTLDPAPVRPPRTLRMPAEWEPHQGTLLTWPHRVELWRGVHAEVEALFARLAAELSACEEVHINVPNASWQARATAAVGRAGADLGRLHWHCIDSDDVWARDHGPILALDPAGRATLLDFEFNAWGGKFASALDDAVPRELNRAWQLPRVRPRVVLEGGSIDVNGAGDLLTTEAVLLTPTRNPHLDRTGLDAVLRACLGAERVHWLGAGLAGDDTDGHIDDLARFVAPHTIAVVDPPPGHADYAAMQANLARLGEMRGAAGQVFELARLPVPDAIYFHGEQVPASYANFYIANDRVLVPVFLQPADARAIEVLQGLFPTRTIVGLDARALVTWNGGIHCVTQQIPIGTLQY